MRLDWYWSRRIAWHTTQVLFMILGGMGAIAFALTLHWVVLILALLIVALIWLLLYTMELQILGKLARYE